MSFADTHQYFSRFQQIAEYVGWSEEDALRVREAKRWVEPHFRSMIDDFYNAIQKTPDAMKVITGGELQIDRLKKTLMHWIDQLFTGPYDEAYVVQRLQVGNRHVEIGLDQIFVNAALSRLRQRIVDCITEQALKETKATDSSGLAEMLRSVNRILDLDLAVIQDAYQLAFTKLQKQTERYATIGMISGGIAHEVRNPLNVMKTSVYFLKHATEKTPKDKLDKHLDRIGNAVEDANQIVSALSEFARLPEPALNPLSIEEIVAEALDKSRLSSEGSSVKVSIECRLENDQVLGESAQLLIVFGNLIRNALQAVDPEGEVEIVIKEVNGKKAVVIRDNGMGIEKENLSRIADPLYSTKPKGLGLGLAITKAILDSHKAELRVESEPGVGSEFKVLFPLREAPLA